MEEGKGEVGLEEEGVGAEEGWEEGWEKEEAETEGKEGEGGEPGEEGKEEEGGLVEREEGWEPRRRTPILPSKHMLQTRNRRRSTRTTRAFVSCRTRGSCTARSSLATTQSRPKIGTRLVGSPPP